MGERPAYATNDALPRAGFDLRRAGWMALAIVAASVPAALLARGGHYTWGHAPAPPLPSYGTAPAFSLASAGGGPFASDALRDKVWIANFIFTSCTESCPLVTTHMRALERRLSEAGDDRGSPRVRLVSFSVDPERDTPERLATYAASWGARPPSWTFVTGAGPHATEELQRVVVAGLKQGLTFRTVRGEPDIAHSNRFVLIDGAGTLRGFYDSESPEAMDTLTRDALSLAAPAR